jgi:hypothetical protein
MRTTSAPTVVDFLENAMAASTVDIQAMIRATPELVLRRLDEVQALLEDTWVDPDLHEQRSHEKRGELWPVLPSVSVDVIGLARALRADQPKLGRSSASRRTKIVAQSLLLYAHGTHMPNPLLAKREDLTSEARFLTAVSDICVLAPLIRGGVMRVHKPLDDPLALVPEDLRDRMDDWGARLGIAIRAFEGHRQILHQGLLRKAGDALLSRALGNILDLNHREAKVTGSLLFPTEYDRATLSMLAGELGVCAESEHPELIRLNQLVRLSLPGLSAVELRDMVNIRSDESFGVFRSDVADAMTVADADIERGAMDMAIRVVAEHMDAGLARLNATTSRGLLKEATVPNVVGWGVGAAAAMSVAGWQGFVATLLGRTAAKVALDRPTSGQRALRSHYVELGSGSLKFGENGEFSAPETTDLREMHTDRSDARRKILGRLRKDSS